MENLNAYVFSLSFHEALEEIMERPSRYPRMTYDGLNGAVYIHYLELKGNDDTTGAYLMLETTDGKRLPWTPGQNDLFRRDWMIGTDEL